MGIQTNWCLSIVNLNSRLLIREVVVESHNPLQLNINYLYQTDEDEKRTVNDRRSRRSTRPVKYVEVDSDDEDAEKTSDLKNTGKQIFRKV